MRVPKLNKHWTIWSRVIAIIVTLALLWVVFRRIDLDTLRVSLGRISWSWFALGFVAYGVAMLFGSLRLHIAFRLTNAASHFLASCRIFLVGHFLFLVLFGAAGGDLAKSAVYSRWFRCGMPEVLAAAPFDRLLGLCSAMVLVIGVLAFALATGSFAEIERMPLGMTGVWAVGMVAAMVLVVLGICIFRPKGQGFIGRTIGALRVGVRRLFSV